MSMVYVIFLHLRHILSTIDVELPRIIAKKFPRLNQTGEF